MKYLKIVFTVLLGALLILGGIAHFMNPTLSSGFIPDFLPKDLVHIVIGVIELALGIGIFIPKFRIQAAWGIFILMLGFLPLHIMDLFREMPIIGSQKAATIRVPFQFLFLYMSWYVAKNSTLSWKSPLSIFLIFS